MTDKTSDKKHGGIRQGAGRPKVKAGSVVMRVPDQYRAAIKDLISQLDSLKTQPSKAVSESNCMVHLDNADLKGSAWVKINVGKY